MNIPGILDPQWRLNAALILVFLTFLVVGSDFLFDALSVHFAPDDCSPRVVESVDTTGFWNATVHCGKDPDGESQR